MASGQTAVPGAVRRPSSLRRSCATRRGRSRELRADVPAELGPGHPTLPREEPRGPLPVGRDVRADAARRGDRGATAPARGRLRLTPAVAAADSGAARADEGFWVAVLPFKHRGADPEPHGPGRGAVRGDRDRPVALLLPPGDRRAARPRSTPPRQWTCRAVGEELGARYVMEGSLRQAGSHLRVAVQLVDASSGAHLWAETYDRPFRPERGLRASGRPRSPDRLDGRRLRTASCPTA